MNRRALLTSAVAALFAKPLAALTRKAQPATAALEGSHGNALWSAINRAGPFSVNESAYREIRERQLRAYSEYCEAENRMLYGDPDAPKPRGVIWGGK